MKNAFFCSNLCFPYFHVLNEKVYTSNHLHNAIKENKIKSLNAETVDCGQEQEQNLRNYIVQNTGD